PFGGLGGVLPGIEDHGITYGVRAGVDRRGRLRRPRPRMDAHIAEVGPEARFEERPRPGIQWLALLAQHIMDDGGHFAHGRALRRTLQHAGLPAALGAGCLRPTGAGPLGLRPACCTLHCPSPPCTAFATSAPSPVTPPACHVTDSPANRSTAYPSPNGAPSANSRPSSASSDARICSASRRPSGQPVSTRRSISTWIVSIGPSRHPAYLLLRPRQRPGRQRLVQLHVLRPHPLRPLLPRYPLPARPPSPARP